MEDQEKYGPARHPSQVVVEFRHLITVLIEKFNLKASHIADAMGVERSWLSGHYKPGRGAATMEHVEKLIATYPQLKDYASNSESMAQLREIVRELQKANDTQRVFVMDMANRVTKLEGNMERVVTKLIEKG